MPFLGKSGPKSQSYQFRLKFGIYTNSNMQILMVVFTFFVLDQKCLSWANLVENVKIVSLRLDLVASPNSSMQNSNAVFAFFIFDWKRPFGAN